MVDRSRYLVPTLGKDCKLHGLARIVDHLVCHIRQKHKHDITVNYLIKVVINDKRRRDDNKVDVENHSSYRHLMIFRHHCRNDVGTAGAAVVRKGNTNARTTQHGAYNTVEKRLRQRHRIGLEEWLCYTYKQTEKRSAEYRFQHELRSDDFKSNRQQRYIECIERYPYRYLCLKINK